MQIHVTATKEEVLESLGLEDSTEEHSKLDLESSMIELIRESIDSSADIAGYKVSITIGDMQ